MAKAASLVEGVQGGFLDDVDATIISCKTGEYTYTNSNTVANGLIVAFDGPDGEHIEFYSSGKAAPTEDGTGFDVKLDMKSKAKQFIDSLLALKFPNVDTDVRVFEGAKVHVNRKALPKMAGIDKEGDKDKTVLLVTKIIALPGAKGATRPSGVQAGQRTTATTIATSKSAASANGEIDAAAIATVLELVAMAPQQTMTRLKLGTAALTTLAKADHQYHSHMMAVKKLASDSTWLAAQAEVAGWVFDNDTVSLPQ